MAHPRPLGKNHSSAGEGRISKHGRALFPNGSQRVTDGRAEELDESFPFTYPIQSWLCPEIAE